MPTRPYQDDAVDSLVANIRHRLIMRNLIVLPTGAGKMVVATRVATRGLQWGHKILFLVHRDELVTQAVEKFQKYIPDARVGVEKAQSRVNPADCDIVVASIQTLSNEQRLVKFDPDQFMVLVDEAHHCVSKQWLKVLEYFGLDEQPPRPIVGFTATPMRGDGKGLDRVFDDIPCQRSMRDLMEDGVPINGQIYPYLANFVGWRVQTEADISRVSRSKGDLDTQELAVKVNTPERNELVVRKYRELGEGAPFIAFTVDIAHSEELARVFTQAGLEAHAISSNTPTALRRDLVKDYKRGSFPGLVSCDALSEGFDAERATVGLGTRPTTSPVVFQQQVGRVARPYPSPEDYLAMLQRGERPSYVKKNAIWIDFCDQAGKHDICRLPSLFGMNKDFDLKGKSVLAMAKKIERAEEEYPGLDLEEATDEYEATRILRSHTERIELFSVPESAAEVRAMSRLAWVKGRGDRYHVSAPLRKMSITVSKNLVGKWEIHTSHMGERTWVGTYTELDTAIRMADSLVPDDDRRVARVGAKWESNPCTRKQVNFLWNLSVANRDGFKDADQMFRKYRKLHRAGDSRYSKGGLRDAIEIAKRIRGRK